MGAKMVPKTVLCDECGQAALVRSYGRIEYDWPKTTADGQVATMPTINSIRVTVDCPLCGVKQLEFRLRNTSRPPRPPPTVNGRFRWAK
jgi:hypothetical protein